MLSRLPEDVPVLVETSYSNNYGPEYHGINTRTQWWCEAVRRPRRNDCIARVAAPGRPTEPVLTLTLPADDLDDAETAARFAVSVTRWLVAYALDRDDQEALGELTLLLGSSGPMAGASGRAWYRVLEWLDAGELATLDLVGDGFPQTWTIAEVADFLGYTGAAATGSARKQLSRWGIESVGRQPGRGGQSLYAVDQVRAAHANRPGRGARTDLQTK